MTDVQIKLTEFSDLIARYTADFVGRQWLVKQVDELLDDPDCRFVVLTGGAGVGKTAFLAHLAATHPQWPRYFIRRDSKDLLRPGDANTFLLTIGGQLATLYPHLFHPENLEIVVCQRIGSVEVGGEATGTHIEELRASPLYHVAVLVEQKIQRLAGRATALEIGRLVSEPRLLGMQDLQYLGLLDPVRLLAQENPDARIVVLVDALDELRYSPAEPDIVRALREMPEMPPNLRIVISSRPESVLDGVLERSDARELRLDVDGADNRSDLRTYAEGAIGGDGWNSALSQEGLSPELFVDGLLEKAVGNFLYLKSVLGAIQQALEDPDKWESVGHLLRIEELPGELGALYSHFLSFIVQWTEHKFGSVAWREYLRPFLGSLAVAQEPLSEDQIIALTGLDRESIRDLQRELRQFVEPVVGELRAYRIYHASFAEYLLDREQNRDYWIDGQARHCRIADRYLDAWGRLEAGLPELQDPTKRDLDGGYGLRHLAVHLAQSERIEDLQDLVENPSWYLARSLQDPSHREYVDDLDLAFTVTLPQGTDGWPSLAANTLIRTTLAGIVGGLPDEAYEALVRLNRGYEALNRARTILDRSKKTRVFERIRDAGLELGLHSFVDETQRELSMTDTARDSPKIEEDEDWLTDVVSRYGAERTLLDLLLPRTDANSDRSEDVKQSIRVARIALQLGHIEEGRQVLLDCLTVVAETWAWDRWEFLTQIARMLAQAGYDNDLFRVIDLAREIEMEPERTYCLAELTVICSETSNIALHKYSLNSTLTEMERCQQKRYLTQGTSKIALAMSRIGDARAEEFLQNALLLSEKHLPASLQEAEQAAWLNIAAALTSAGLCDEAIDLTRSFERSMHMHQVRNALVALAQQDRWQDAWHIALDLHPLIRTRALLDMSIALAEREHLTTDLYEASVSQIEKDRQSHINLDTWVQTVEQLITLAARMQDIPRIQKYLENIIDFVGDMHDTLQVRAIRQVVHHAVCLPDQEPLGHLTTLAKALPEDNRYHRSHALSAISIALATSRQTDRAWSLAQEIDADWKRLEASVRICELTHQQGEDILPHFKIALRLARQVQNGGVVPLSWGALAHLAHRLGQDVERDECVAQAVEGVYQPAFAAGSVAYNAANVALILREIGFTNQASELVEYTLTRVDPSDSQMGPHAWRSAVKALTRMNQPELWLKGYKAVDTIKDPGLKAAALLDIIETRMQLGHREHALNNLSLALSAVDDAGNNTAVVTRFVSILLELLDVQSQEMHRVVAEFFSNARIHDRSTVLTWIAGMLPVFAKANRSFVNRAWVKIRQAEVMLSSPAYNRG